MATCGLVALCAVAGGTVAAQELKVGITETLTHVDVVHDGKRVRIQRIQDTSHRLAGDWAMTSRPCPPSCIQPIEAAPGVATVGELELLDFLARQVGTGVGLLLDVRPPADYHAETIPGSVNLPLQVVRSDNPHVADILLALGARRHGEQWSFDDAKVLLLFGAGAWSDQAPRVARGLLVLGYPAAKLKVYRGGLQAWRSLGLTTVIAGAPR